MAQEIVETSNKGISKKVRMLSADGCVLSEKTVSVSGDCLQDCYKYLRKTENDD